MIGFGFTAANQLYGLAGSVMPRQEAGNAMGVVSLGAGLFGYFGPQMLGILRDRTGLVRGRLLHGGRSPTS